MLALLSALWPDYCSNALHGLPDSPRLFFCASSHAVPIDDLVDNEEHHHRHTYHPPARTSSRRSRQAVPVVASAGRFRSNPRACGGPLSMVSYVLGCHLYVKHVMVPKLVECCPSGRYEQQSAAARLASWERSALVVYRNDGYTTLPAVSKRRLDM